MLTTLQKSVINDRLSALLPDEPGVPWRRNFFRDAGDLDELVRFACKRGEVNFLIQAAEDAKKAFFAVAGYKGTEQKALLEGDSLVEALVQAVGAVLEVWEVPQPRVKARPRPQRKNARNNEDTKELLN